MNKPLNLRTVSLKLPRYEVNNLMLACSALSCAAGEDGNKWANLHDKLAAILEDFDHKQEILEELK